jgi:hypothetical protein
LASRGRDTQLSEIGERIKDLAERTSLAVPAEDPDYEDLGPAFPAHRATERDAILQPPKPVIKPSERVLGRAREGDHALEAVS